MNGTYVDFSVGFAPDANPRTAGVVPDCVNFIPTHRGMMALQTPSPREGSVSASPSAASETVLGYGFMRLTEQTLYINDYVGTSAALRERNSVTGAWSDKSRTAGYTGVVVWSFEPFGTDYIIAAAADVSVTGKYPLQQGVPASGVFTDITGSPTCGVITSAERFVLAFNSNANADAWHCSARDSHTSWTVSPSTLAAQGRLVDPPGPINAARAFGNDVIAYKHRAMIRGRFVPGDPEVWKWERLPFTMGAGSPRAVTSLPDGRHAFLNAESCYLFDGASVVDVLQGRARDWYKGVVSSLSAHPKMAAVYDARRSSVWYTVPTSSNLTGAIVLHVPTNKLGYARLPADLVMSTPDPVSINAGNTAGFFDTVNHKQWSFSPDAAFGTIGAFAVGDSFDGVVGMVDPYITTHDVGDPDHQVSFESVRVDWMYFDEYAAPHAVTVRSRDARHVTGSNETVASCTAVDATYQKFTARSSKHWHRVRLTAANAYCELAGMWVNAQGLDGRRK